jgi:hypothetical protein
MNLMKEKAIDGDIDTQNIVYVTKEKYVISDANSMSWTGNFLHELPILAKIKSQDQITGRNLVLLFLGSDNDPQQQNKPQEIIMKSIITGSALREAEIVYPQRIVPTDLQQAIIITDPRYHDDYVITGLLTGKADIFKYEKGTPLLNHISSPRLVPTGNKLLDIAYRGIFIFFLIMDEQSSELSLLINRFETDPILEIRRLCFIKLEKVENLKRYPELRVKGIKNSYIVLVNYPGKGITQLSFQHPGLGIEPFECPKVTTFLEYDGQLGYSFDYMIQDFDDGYKPYGILLSSIHLGLKEFAFAPYCLPNMTYSEQNGCSWCNSGYSKGGVTKQCTPCQNTVLPSHRLEPDFDPAIQNCPSTCDKKGTFGPTCVPCKDYMESQGLTPPRFSHWGINDNGACTFICEGDKLPLDNKCLEITKYERHLDACSTIKDCYNCSLSDSCFWSNGTCINFARVKNRPKRNLHLDYFIPASECQDEHLRCGKTMYPEDRGIISFSSTSLPRNQFCLWSLEFDNFHSKRIDMDVEFQLTTDLFMNDPKLKKIIIYYLYCTRSGLDVECGLEKLDFSHKEQIKLNALRMQFVAWVQDDVKDVAKQFSIAYKFDTARMAAIDLIKSIKIGCYIAIAIAACLAIFFPILHKKYKPRLRYEKFKDERGEQEPQPEEPTKSAIIELTDDNIKVDPQGEEKQIEQSTTEEI